jgi:hypothetical protein
MCSKQQKYEQIVDLVMMNLLKLELFSNANSASDDWIEIDPDLRNFRENDWSNSWLRKKDRNFD